jgi:DNA-binding response OmpR family regulator
MMLTARDAVEDRVLGLDLGADDYLTKPFSLDEFEARVRALLRRPGAPASSTFEVGPMEIDLAARRLKIRGSPVDLTTREWALLRLFLQHPGRVLSKEQIAERMYGWREEVESNAVEVHVHHLRRKLAPEVIVTVRGVGYLLPKDLA